jgi:hypothetical protein
MKNYTTFLLSILFTVIGYSQSVIKTMLRLPDTGQNSSYTSTFGEDNDYNINNPYFIIHGDGTITDTITGLMWQQIDGGEMTIENAVTYCGALTLAGYSDWRLPNAHEAFSILNFQNTNPSLNTSVFPISLAEYWWTSDRQLNDNTKVWVTNSGGGIGNHPKTETISAGGPNYFHTRAVRDIYPNSTIPNHFTDNLNGTITDNVTNLIWQKNAIADSLTWEGALINADTMLLGGYNDWRLPNIKELQSINNEQIMNPSINTTYFANIGIDKVWSSTTLPNQTTKAWYLDTQYGVTTYQTKTIKQKVLFVRTNQNVTAQLFDEFTMNASGFLFPNPFTSAIMLPKNLENVSAVLLNNLGEIIYSGKQIQMQDFSNLPVGIYFVTIKQDKSMTYKLVK